MPDLGEGIDLFVFPGGMAAVTPDGGYAVRAINKTGGVSVKGQLLEASSSTNRGVQLTGVDDVDPVAVMYSDGIADGSEVWVVVAGYAYVLLDDATGSTRGNWCETSEAGYVDATAGSPAAAPTHFNETGHAAETVSAGAGGTHQLMLMWVHFL